MAELHVTLIGASSPRCGRAVIDDLKSRDHAGEQQVAVESLYVVDCSGKFQHASGSVVATFDDESSKVVTLSSTFVLSNEGVIAVDRSELEGWCWQCHSACNICKCS